MSRFFKRSQRQSPALAPRDSEKIMEAELKRQQRATRILRFAIDKAVKEYNQGQPNPRTFQISLMDGNALGDSPITRLNTVVDAISHMEDDRVRLIEVSPGALLGPYLVIHLNV